MAGIGANYAVWVEFGLKNRMAAGMRAVQSQLRGVQAQVNAASKQSGDYMKRVQQHVSRYGTIWGSPKNYEEARRNLNTIHQQRVRLQNQLAVTEGASRRAALQTQLQALQMTERDVQAKAQSFRLTEATAAAQMRSNVANERSRYRMIAAEQRERRDAERDFQRRQQAYRNIGDGAFRTAQYAGIGGAVIGGGLFEAWKMAAQQQQLATTTAMVLGFKGAAQTLAANELFKSQLTNSMQVGLLSSADIASVQTQLAMHVPGLGMKNLLALTPLVAKFADVMKMTNIPGAEDPAQSGAVAAMIANVFNARGPAQMRKILEQFFVMEQSTGADVSTSVNAISQYGALGKSLGFSAQDMIDLYGAMFRLGAGKGKVGARLGTLLTRIGTIPTSVMRAWGSTNLGLVDTHGIPNILKEKGGPSFDTYLRFLGNAYAASIRKFGPAAGKARFLTAMTATYGATGEKALFPLIQSGSIQNYEAQIKRHQQFSTIEQAQATFFNLPINEWKRFMTNLQTLIIAFGHADMKTFSNFFATWADTLERWTNWMSSHKAQTQEAFDTFVRIAEILLAVSGSAFTIGMIAKITNGIIATTTFLTTLGGGEGVLTAYLAATGRATVAANALAGAEARAAGSTFWKNLGAGTLRITSFLGATSIAAIASAFIFGAWKNAKMFKPGQIAPGQLNGPYGNNYYAPPPGVGPDWTWNPKANRWEPPVMRAPSSSSGNTTEVHVYVGNKKIVPDTIRILNRNLRGGVRSTTTGQSTTRIPAFETLDMALHPHVH